MARLFERLSWVTLAAPLALALTSVLAVALAASPTPFQDQWDTIWWWRAIQERGLSVSYLVAQHNEHRILLPRLVFLADLQWFGGRNTLSLAAIGLVQAAGAFLFLRLGLRRGGALPIVGAATAAALICSLVQWENLFWGFQLQFVAVWAAGAWAIWLFCAGTGRDAPTRWPALAGAAVLLVLATFSMANGVLAGVAMVLVALVARLGARAAAMALTVTAVLAAVYLQGYQPISQHSPAAALQDPLGFVTYVLTYLGAPWAIGAPPVAMAFGAAGTLLTGLMARAVLRDGGYDSAQAAMLGIALFAGLTAGVTALGRLGLGAEFALSSRYTTAGCYFWAAQAVFWSLRAAAGYRPAGQGAVGAALLLGLAVLLPIQVLMLPGLVDAKARILFGSSAMLGGTDDERAFAGLYPRPQQVRELTPFLKAERLSLFATEPPMPARIFATIPCAGRIDRWAPSGPGAYRAEGRSGSPRVLLTDEAGRPVGVGLGGLPGVRLREIALQPHDRWVASVAPREAKTIIAYAIGTDGAPCRFAHQRVAP